MNDCDKLIQLFNQSNIPKKIQCINKYNNNIIKCEIFDILNGKFYSCQETYSEMDKNQKIQLKKI